MQRGKNLKIIMEYSINVGQFQRLLIEMPEGEERRVEQNKCLK